MFWIESKSKVKLERECPWKFVFLSLNNKGNTRLVNNVCFNKLNIRYYLISNTNSISLVGFDSVVLRKQIKTKYIYDNKDKEYDRRSIR